MWFVVLIHALPACVTLYGLLVLITGEVSGFGSREVRGTPGRLLGLVLASALPLALTVGPLVRFPPFVRKPDLTGYDRDLAITREILEERRQLSAWREKHAPPTDPEPGEGPADGRTPEERLRQRAEQTKARVRALQAFAAEYERQATRTDERIEGLRQEQARIREERKARAEQREKAAGRDGPLYVGAGVLLLVWVLAWLVGRPPERAGPPAGPEEPPAG